MKKVILQFLRYVFLIGFAAFLVAGLHVAKNQKQFWDNGKKKLQELVQP